MWSIDWKPSWSVINSTTGKYCSLAFMWMVTWLVGYNQQALGNKSRHASRFHAADDCCTQGLACSFTGLSQSGKKRLLVAHKKIDNLRKQTTPITVVTFNSRNTQNVTLSVAIFLTPPNKHWLSFSSSVKFPRMICYYMQIEGRSWKVMQASHDHLLFA